MRDTSDDLPQRAERFRLIAAKEGDRYLASTLRAIADGFDQRIELLKGNVQTPNSGGCQAAP